MKLAKTSILTGVLHVREIDVTSEQIFAWMNNRRLMIQDAFPHLSDDDREFILTGITPEEWKTLTEALIPEDEDEEPKKEDGDKS